MNFEVAHAVKNGVLQMPPKEETCKEKTQGFQHVMFNVIKKKADDSRRVANQPIPLVFLQLRRFRYIPAPVPSNNMDLGLEFTHEILGIYSTYHFYTVYHGLPCLPCLACVYHVYPFFPQTGCPH